MCGIYAITLEDDKVMYVGKSKNVLKRIKQHIEGIDQTKTKMYWLLNKMESFGVKFWLVEKCDEDELDYLEKFWIKRMKPVLNTQVPQGCERYINKVESVTDAYVQALENGRWDMGEGFIEKYCNKIVRD